MSGEDDFLAEVIPGRLWQSGSRIDAGEAQRFDAVVTLGSEHQSWRDEWMKAGWSLLQEGRPRLPVVLHAPLIDATGWLDKATADAVARFILTLLGCDRKVLIHCDAGAFRSVFMAALVVKAVRKTSGAAALRQVERARGRNGKRATIGPRDFDEMLNEWMP